MSEQIIWTEHGEDIINSDVDVVIELTGDVEFAHACVRQALAAGKHVVTAPPPSIFPSSTRSRAILKIPPALFCCAPHPRNAIYCTSPELFCFEVLAVRLRLCSLVLSVVALSFAGPASAEQWSQPTPEELSMTSQPGAPNASAVILFHEETADDTLRMHSEYVRIKVLTEKGKERADIEIPYLGRLFTITDAGGRTIHSDGTIIPFTGKPYEKTIVKSKEYSYKAKVFTLPDVQVGSIIEFRYKLRYEDDSAIPPRWYVQSDLYLRRGHYHFVPTTHDLMLAHGNISNGGALSYYRNLPNNVEITRGNSVGYFDMVVHDIPPLPDEDYLPPTRSLSYRVLFFYTSYHDQTEFWRSEGKYWSKAGDEFANAKNLRDIAAQLVAPADTQEQKLHKLYAAAQSVENTDFTHTRDAVEEKSEGFKNVKTSVDIWKRKRGTSDQIALLFVGLARAAGFKAYRMSVVNRDENVFNPYDTEVNQLDDDVAIVEVNGKEVFFDPGEKFCPYGQMHWKHTVATGLRQMPDGSTSISNSGPLAYTDNVTSRIAQLTLAEDGTVSGPVRLSYTGHRALVARQATIERQGAELQKYFEDELRDMLPGGLDIHLNKFSNLDDVSQPFVLDYYIKGSVGTGSSHRLLLPQSIFEVNEKQPFTAAQRTNRIYFHYPYREADTVQFTLPDDIKVDNLPKTETTSIAGFGLYATKDAVQGQKLILQREIILASLLSTPDDYQKIKGFFGTVRSRDEDQALLSRTSSTKGK